MTAHARVSDDATFVDEEARWSLFLSILDRIATALEAANEPAQALKVAQDAYEATRASDLPPDVLAPFPGTVAPSFPVGPVPAAVPVTPLPVPVATWACPVHNQVKVVPAGLSKTKLNPDGSPKAYAAFLACPVAGCQQKPPR
jgi:hypothetical protein